MLRLSPPAHGRLEEARTFDAHVAGSELNVAVALASLGVDDPQALRQRFDNLREKSADEIRDLYDFRIKGIENRG